MVELLPIHSHIYSSIDAGLSSPLDPTNILSHKHLHKEILFLISYQTHRWLRQNIHHRSIYMVELLPIHSHIYSAFDAGPFSPLDPTNILSRKYLQLEILSLISYQTRWWLRQNIHHLINLHGRVASYPLPYIFRNWCRSIFLIRHNKCAVPQISTVRNSFINILSNTQMPKSKYPSPDQFTW